MSPDSTSPLPGLPPSTLLHGTSALAAAQIAVEGFRLLPDDERPWAPGALGQGLYVTHSMAWAVEFMRDFAGRGDGVLIPVELRPGTRFLRIEGHWDPKVLDSLRREFGAGILREDFPKAIPRNKHLKNHELIALMNYLVTRSRRMVHWEAGARTLSAIRKLLRKAGYDGFGNLVNDLGLVVFDPARLRPSAFLRFDGVVERRDCGDGRLELTHRPKLLDATPAWLRATASARLAELEGELASDLADPDLADLFTPKEITEQERRFARMKATLARLA